ncbi:hypothetical protein HELRODRAFT_176769 [Helobdella robusta]|uniref:Neurotransmitter-gated ion-channel ligand-binding domain-containing protein n=1 Tax=Helobdella robusta TaxID=6412 RepID=T1FAW3_HELRO|nr:hypothetical protein HELRODRAFT_176769 [Helobdella robusta]ESN99604.1 hypothetical protein HELRODRAFT_176769 [Helobdella robusta]
MSEQVSAASLSSTVRAMERLIRSHIHVMEKSAKLLEPPPETKTLVPSAVSSMLGKKKGGKEVIKKQDKVTVYVKVLFLKIGVIDTIHDRYTAEIMVQTKWRETSLDGSKIPPGEIDLGSYWNPKVAISNGIGDLKYTTTNFVEFDQIGRAWVYERRRTNGQFFEFMELNKFPFDGQDLTVTITSERVDSELEFIQDDSGESAVNAEAFSAAQEWKLHGKVNIWTKVNVKKVNKKKMRYPCFCVAAKVARRPQFFIYNIIVIMFSICSLAFATFTVKPEAPESRLPLTFFLVLTTVTFKFVVNKSLPKISYLTYLDKYILGSMVILCTICIWHSIAGSLVNNATQNTSATSTTAATLPTTTKAVAVTTTLSTSVVSCPAISKPPSTPFGKTIDQSIMGVFAVIYVGFHLCFIFLIICKGADDEVNESLNVSEDDDDEDAEKKESRSNMAMVALGLFGNGDKVSPTSDSMAKASPQGQTTQPIRSGGRLQNGLPPVHE